METRKNLCAMLPVALHTRVRQEQEKAGMTLGEYVEAMITEYYDWKDGKIMTGEMRTLAAQIPAELFDRLDRYLKERGIKKKDFLSEELIFSGKTFLQKHHIAVIPSLFRKKQFLSEPISSFLSNMSKISASGWLFCSLSTIIPASSRHACSQSPSVCLSRACPAPSHPLCSTLSASISRSVPMSPLQQKQRIHQDALLLQVPS